MLVVNYEVKFERHIKAKFSVNLKPRADFWVHYEANYCLFMFEPLVRHFYQTLFFFILVAFRVFPLKKVKHSFSVKIVGEKLLEESEVLDL